MRPSTRRLVPALFAGTLLFTACGGSDGDAEEPVTTVDSEPSPGPAETEPVVTEVSVPVATEPVATEPVATEPVATEPVATEVPEPEAGIVDVALSEWAIDAPTEIAAGTVTFNASNGGSFPHELVVIAGEGYESLPLEEGGKVIEEQLPTGALIDRTPRISPGLEDQLVVDLTPGNYVLICNLGGGSTSHAGAGQRLDITVIG